MTMILGDVGQRLFKKRWFANRPKDAEKFKHRFDLLKPKQYTTNIVKKNQFEEYKDGLYALKYSPQAYVHHLKILIS